MEEEMFTGIKLSLESYNKSRENLIAKGRVLLLSSKKAMYNTHRDEFEKASVVFQKADSIAQELIDSYKDEYRNKFGAVTAALQEWCEAKAYFVYATESRLLKLDESGLEPEDYLLGLADLAGELTRRAVVKSISKDTETVKAIRVFLEELWGAFLNFDFRNGELRKKTDSVRWNLQKVEELLVR